MLTKRPAIDFIKENLKGDLVGVEIGVWRGENAESILQHSSINMLYLIDPYIYYEGFIRIPSVGNIIEDEQIAKNRLSDFKHKIKFTKLKSDEAVHTVPEKVDFIYIDGNHDYAYIKNDIKNYWGKIKKGGVLGGHDYNACDPGVNQAVDEFVAENKLILHVEPHDWWVVKP